jgi:hypothetical protein
MLICIALVTEVFKFSLIELFLPWGVLTIVGVPTYFFGKFIENNLRI